LIRQITVTVGHFVSIDIANLLVLWLHKLVLHISFMISFLMQSWRRWRIRVSTFYTDLHVIVIWFNDVHVTPLIGTVLSWHSSFRITRIE